MKTHYHRLLVRPKTLPNETALGYGLRLGEANGLHGLAWLTRQAKIQDDRPSFAQSLTQMTGYDQIVFDSLAGPAPHNYQRTTHWQQGLKVTYWNSGHRRWCPQCLAERGYWHIEWMLTLQVACPTHGTLLAETCPACSKRIGWYEGDLTHCSCGADLRMTDTPPTTQAQHHLSALIHEAFTNGPSLPADANTALGTPDLHLPQLCDLLWFFGAYALHDLRFRPQKIPHHGEISVIQPFISMALYILQDWPTHFHDLLDQFVAPTTGNVASLRLYLRQMHQALEKLLAHPDLLFIREAFEQYVHLRWPDMIVLQHQFQSQHPIISCHAAAKKLGVSTKIIQQLLKQGCVLGHKTIGPNGKVLWMIDRLSLTLYQQNSTGFINMSQAVSMLRIWPQRIRLLIAEGILHPIRTADSEEGNSRHWLFAQHDVQALLDQLNHGHISALAHCPSVISIWEIMKRWMQGNQAFLHLIRALLNEELSVVGRDPDERGLRALLLHRETFMAWHTHYRQAQGFFTIPEAARKLHMNKNTLYNMVKTHQVATVYERIGYEGKLINGIRAEEVERLREERTPKLV